MISVNNLIFTITMNRVKKKILLSYLYGIIRKDLSIFLTNIDLISRIKLQNPFVKKLKVNCNKIKQGLAKLKSKLVTI